MNFRARPEMFVCFPKRQLTAFVDLTMPRRDWTRYEVPTKARRFLAPRYREQVSKHETAPNLFITRQAG